MRSKQDTDNSVFSTQQLVVTFEVEGEVVRPGERSVAHLASVWSDPGVFPHVPAQLVRAGELPAAALPGAHVGLFPSVGPQVRLHVRGLVVSLVAIVVGAVVDLRHLPHPPDLANLYWKLQRCCGLGQCCCCC